MLLCCLKCGWIPGLRPQLAGLHIPPIGSQLVHSLSIVDLYPLNIIRAGCGTRFRGMRSLTFAACANKTLFSIIFTTSPLAKSWIRACCGMTQVRCEDYVVLLGIELDHMLTFNDHITDICKKSARQLAVLKRLGHLLALQGKIAFFKSFISSNFNYCPLIWHFCSQCNTNKLEKFQERALRFVYNDYISSHADLLKTAGTEYLHIKRVKEMAREV